MILYIDTTKGQDIVIGLKEGKGFLLKKKFTAQYIQAEKLLPKIDQLLKQKKLLKTDITKIEVENRGGSIGSKSGTSFTALRIGVVTANALGYALNIPVKSKMKNISNIVKPVYNKEPNVTISKKSITYNL